MRLSVVLDISPDEVPRCRELLAVLQSLSASININGDEKQVFLTLLSQLAERPSAIDDTRDLILHLLLQRLGDCSNEAVTAGFTQALREILGTPDPQRRPIWNYLRVLTLIPSSLRAHVLSKVVNDILAALNSSRPALVIASHAEALAGLARSRLVDLNGVLHTINHLLDQAPQRAVGSAVLVRILQDCGEELRARGDTALLSATARRLLAMTDAECQPGQLLLGRWLLAFDSNTELRELGNSLVHLVGPPLATAAPTATQLPLPTYPPTSGPPAEASLPSLPRSLPPAATAPALPPAPSPVAVPAPFSTPVPQPAPPPPQPQTAPPPAAFSAHHGGHATAGGAGHGGWREGMVRGTAAEWAADGSSTEWMAEREGPVVTRTPSGMTARGPFRPSTKPPPVPPPQSGPHTPTASTPPPSQSGPLRSPRSAAAGTPPHQAPGRPPSPASSPNRSSFPSPRGVGDAPLSTSSATSRAHTAAPSAAASSSSPIALPRPHYYDRLEVCPQFEPAALRSAPPPAEVRAADTEAGTNAEVIAAAVATLASGVGCLAGCVTAMGTVADDDSEALVVTLAAEGALDAWTADGRVCRAACACRRGDFILHARGLGGAGDGQHVSRYLLPLPWGGGASIDLSRVTRKTLASGGAVYTGIVASALSAARSLPQAHAAFLLACRSTETSPLVFGAPTAAPLRLPGSDVTAIKLLATPPHHCVTGECFSSEDGAVVFYDIDRLALGSTEPLATLHGHKGMVTALAECEATGALVSASRDATVVLWDPRQQGSIGSIAKGRHSLGHQGPVTALCVDQHFLMTGSLDRKVMVWDLRHYDRPARPDVCVDDTPITCVQLMPMPLGRGPARPLPLAAVATTDGLYCVDPTTTVSSLVSPSTPLRRPSAYHGEPAATSRRVFYAALAWDKARGALYSGGPAFQRFELI